MRVSETQRAQFLSSLAQGSTVKEACAYAGIPRRTIYYLRSEDPEFAGAWDAAIEEGTESLVEEVRRRAFDPSDKWSHVFLMFLIKKRDPSYRDNYKTETTIKHESVKEFTFSKGEIDKAIEILEKQKKASAPIPESEELSSIPASGEVQDAAKDKATLPADA